MSKAQMLLAKTRRGATLIEYALLVIVIMFAAAIAFRTLGKSAAKNAENSATELDDHTRAP